MYKQFDERNKRGAKVHRFLMLCFTCIILLSIGLIFFKVGAISTTARIAMIPTLGVGFDDLVKKAGGMVASHNHYSLYIKGRKKSRNPLSTPQSEQRQLIKLFSKHWQDAGVNQLAWVNYAATHPVEKHGRIIHLTGQVTFVQWCIVAFFASGDAVFLEAPPSVATLFPILTGLTCSAETGPDLVTFQPNIIGTYPEGMMIDTFVSRPQSAGVFTQKDMIKIGTYDPTTAPAIDITAEYAAKYGALIDGQKIFFMARLIMPTGESDLFVKQVTVIIPKPS